MLLKQFRQYLSIERNYSENTVVAYLRDLQGFEAFLGEYYGFSIEHAKLAEKITHRHVRNWMGELLESGISRRSVARKVAATSTFFKFLQKCGTLTTNPASRVKVPKFEKKLPSFVKESDATRLFELPEFPEGYEGARDRAILEILYGCGLRRSELIDLKRRDVDFKSSTIRVMGKGNKERLIPLGKQASEAMQLYLKACSDEGLEKGETFFIRKDGRPLYPKLVYNVTGKYLGQISSLSKKSPHVLRHSFATHLLNAGADLNAIKELLGHKSLAATQVYVHNSISKLKSVYKNAHPKA